MTDIICDRRECYYNKTGFCFRALVALKMVDNPLCCMGYEETAPGKELERRVEANLDMALDRAEEG